jgi:cardiolipin synthase
MEVHIGAPLHAGNDVRLLLNGDGTYPTVWRDMRAAKQTLTVQMYFSLPGVVADTFATIMKERARAGVRTLLLLDAFGSGPMATAWADSLSAAGVEIAWLRPLRWWALHKAAQRSHARVIVIDGAVGFTGGFGLADYWQGDGLHDNQWRESNVRFEGPAVAQLQAAFAAGWAEATGELLTGRSFLPDTAFKAAGSARAALMHTTPTIGSTPAERFYALSIVGARKSIYITNSYFVPDDDLRRMLTAAAKRGVDVRVLAPGPKTDIKSTFYAGRWRYDELLSAGVRIFEYVPTMMHAKTMVVDGRWFSVGSMNFDNRSIAFNNETSLVAYDAKLGAELDSIFIADQGHSREIKLAEWRTRGLWDRVLETGASLLSRVL